MIKTNHIDLTDSITDHFRLAEPQKKALKKLGIEKISDLLYHFPNRYGVPAENFKIRELSADGKAVIYGVVKSINTGKTLRGRLPIAKGKVADETGTVNVIWFNQPYIAKMFPKNSAVKIEGQIKLNKKGEPTIANPKIVLLRDGLQNVPTTPETNVEPLFNQTEHIQSAPILNPVYSKSYGITSNWIFHAIQKILKSDILSQIEDVIPKEILDKYNLPDIKTAMIWIHQPQKESDAEVARKRFAFEEVFLIQIQKQKQRSEIQKLKSYPIDFSFEDVETFTKTFPFELTPAQINSIKTILEDFKKGYPMSRLLEGDVGSGKTAVAAASVFTIANTKVSKTGGANLQTAYMVPTEILAKQHFENFISYFRNSAKIAGKISGDKSRAKIQVALITGSVCYKFPSKLNPKESTKISRTQLSKWVENGEIQIVIGTHALIQKSVKFKNLGLVIIDEQHRFGTEQRRKIAQKDGFIPHLLSMTATPIPRTLALTIYGDLDLTLLDQMPSGRKPIITEIVLPNERDKIYRKIREEIRAGRQAYVICPRIDEPDETKAGAIYAKSVSAEAERLQTEVFPDLIIGKLHGKMTSAEKEKTMREFEIGKIDILVATSVIEVGVNVPNATIIIIEGAERFGLAQLHQLRGRVIRSNHQAFCFVFTDSKSESTRDRLSALRTAKNGFELAEFDLSIRGSGELSGGRQWGITDIGMEAIKNIKMVEFAREEAKNIIESDPSLLNHPKIKERISQNILHFE